MQSIVLELGSLNASVNCAATLLSWSLSAWERSSADGRRALHAALGDDLRLYVVTIDQQRERVTFRVEVTSRTLEDVIGLLTVKLDRATLGRAQSTVIRRPRGERQHPFELGHVGGQRGGVLRPAGP